jgi:hypothetical protein
MAPGRKRRIAGWTLLSLGVAVGGVMVVSRWWSVTIGVGVLSLTCSLGVVHLAHTRSQNDPRPPFGNFYALTDPSLLWWIDSAAPNFPTWSVGIAELWGPRRVGSGITVVASVCSVLLWPIALGSIAAGLWLRRPARPDLGVNSCPGCDYDLISLPPGTPCPECGRAAANEAETLR